MGVLSGRIGYRAGPPQGYGPGMWFYEPAGARHEATQRVKEDEDLVYFANVYGPIQFDSGVGTPVEAVLSWMQYLEMAKAAGAPLVRNSFPGSAGTYVAQQVVLSHVLYKPLFLAWRCRPQRRHVASDS